MPDTNTPQQKPTLREALAAELPILADCICYLRWAAELLAGEDEDDDSDAQAMIQQAKESHAKLALALQQPDAPEGAAAPLVVGSVCAGSGHSVAYSQLSSSTGGCCGICGMPALGTILPTHAPFAPAPQGASPNTAPQGDVVREALRCPTIRDDKPGSPVCGGVATIGFCSECADDHQAQLRDRFDRAITEHRSPPIEVAKQDNIAARLEKRMANCCGRHSSGCEACQADRAALSTAPQETHSRTYEEGEADADAKWLKAWRLFKAGRADGCAWPKSREECGAGYDCNCGPIRDLATKARIAERALQPEGRTR